MPLYKYEAVSSRGPLKGVITADSVDSAKDILRKEHLLITLLQSTSSQSSKQKMSHAAQLDFTRSLSQLLRAGLPLYESLLTLEEKAQKQKHHAIVAALCDQIKQGVKLSKAFELFPQAFNKLYIAIITAGEETGQLSDAFTQLELLIGRSQKLRRDLVSAMIYPLFLLAFCFVVIGTLFFYVIPTMAPLFEGRQLHPITQTVMSMSQWLRQYGQYLGLTLIGMALGLAYYLSLPQGKLVKAKILMKIKPMARIATAASLGRFSRALSILLVSSVSLIDALKLARSTLKHPLFEKIFLLAEESITQGGRFSDTLVNSPLIPSMAARMIAIGEESGASAHMFKQLAEIYEDELSKSLARLTSMLQPLMLIFLAMIVGVVILSVLLPLTDVGSFLN